MLDKNPELNSNKRKIKSYVCRNRKLTPSQQHLVSEFYPVWGLPADQVWDFKQIFQNGNDVVLEIGFGTGRTLIQNAVNNPNYNFVGIEMYQAGCLNILEYIRDHNITNLRVCNGDAQLILQKLILDESLNGVQIFFPDPWPKKRHHKRRLIQLEFIDLLRTKFKVPGFLHLATDWQDYADHMAAVMENNLEFKPVLEENLSAVGIPYLAQNPRLLTRFEEKGLRKGHKIHDLIFKI